MSEISYIAKVLHDITFLVTHVDGCIVTYNNVAQPRPSKEMLVGEIIESYLTIARLNYELRNVSRSQFLMATLAM